MRHLRSTARAATIVFVGALASGLVTGTANAEPTALCNIVYPNPHDFEMPVTSTTQADSTDGVVDFQLHTDSKSDLGYDQTFRVTWANLDTGRSGTETVTARVQGPDNTLTIPDVDTAPGPLALVLAVNNHGTDQNYTNGDCVTEYTAN